ncbi:unnamed protein product [Toxocara canis]|uniref:Protein kinase domain-containing protein n=1 Tax=Toxocara canis TaxID=6265 RepID=A0A183V6P4_TOXCA|nr:unnamed protein product [Toxocara canis]
MLTGRRYRIPYPLTNFLWVAGSWVAVFVTHLRPYQSVRDLPAMVSEMSSRSDRKFLPQLGTEVRSGVSIYKLLSVLGEGGFGTVFEVRRGYRRYAMKVEKYNKSMLHVEAAVMTAAERRSCKHICRVVDYGSQKQKYTFVVMPMLGKDLHTLRHERPSKRFSLGTSLLVGIQTLQAIEELHRPPGNFAVGLREDMQHKTIFLLDFGLAKRYSDRVNRNNVRAAKLMARNASRIHLLHNCPKQYDRLLTAIDAMVFEDEPHYQQMYTILENVR